MEKRISTNFDLIPIPETTSNKQLMRRKETYGVVSGMRRRPNSRKPRLNDEVMLLARHCRHPNKQIEIWRREAHSAQRILYLLFITGLLQLFHSRNNIDQGISPMTPARLKHKCIRCFYRVAMVSSGPLWQHAGWNPRTVGSIALLVGIGGAITSAGQISSSV